MEYTHTLSEPQLQAAREQLAKLAKAATKLGVTPPMLVHSEPREVVRDDNSEAYLEYDCAIVGAEPVIAGYKFVGSINHDESGNIIKLADNSRDEFDTTQFRVGAQKCDHCGQQRYRKDTYLVVHVESKALKQVGSSCLRDFLGHGDPQAIMSYVQNIIEFMADMDDDDSFGRYYSGGRYGEPRMGIVFFLANICAMIDEYGWLSKTRAADEMRASEATVERALFNVRDLESGDRKRIAEAIQINEAHYELARTSLAWLASDIVTKPVETRSDYEHNLCVACGNGIALSFQTRQAGIVGSLIAAYRRAMSQAAERKAAALQSHHYGEPGWKLVGHTMLVTHVYDNANDYGVSYKHIMRDLKGNVFTWQSSTYRLNENTRYQISGTVKAHTEYRGIKQTQLTRCKFAEVPDEVVLQ
jgi:hypothetical protein